MIIKCIPIYEFTSAIDIIKHTFLNTNKCHHSMAIHKEKTVLVKEKVRMFKFGNVFEFFNLQNHKIGEAREEEISGFKKFVKLTKYKSMLPFTIGLYDAQGNKVVTLRKPFRWWMAEVFVHDKDDNVIGRYKQKFKFLKPTFYLYENEQEFAKIEGNFTAWNFNITSPEGHDYGQIDKKFAGIAKEFLTTADNYVVRLDHDSLNENQQKILSSVSCVIDLIFKEYN